MIATFVISSGTGPAPVRHFVALLAKRFCRVAADCGTRVLRQHIEGDDASPFSVHITVSASPEALSVLRADCGTHALLAPAADRSRHGRKRWFASVRLLTDDPVPSPGSLRDQDLRVQFCRAGGPGGQHVNKRDTAVRAVHLPTGVSLRVADQRSQQANRRLARDRLESRLRDRDRAELERRQALVRIGHYRLERGRPVRRYVLDRQGDLLECVR